MIPKKRVLILSREFNDNDFVSEYVKKISTFLAEKGIRTNVVCFGGVERNEKLMDIVDVHSVGLLINGNNLFNWAIMMNKELERRGREIYELEGFDIIHANDWITATAGISLSKLTDRPLIVTIHSTERERGFGIDYSGLISDIEWLAAFEADYVIADKKTTYNCLLNDFNIPIEKLMLIDPLKNGWRERLLKIYEKTVR